MKNSKRIENAGCDKCGTLDRMPESNLCEQCSIEHTPGPWEFVGTKNFRCIISHADNTVAELPKYGAGFIPKGEQCPWHNAEANARLISAAPELLEALKGIIEFEHECTCGQFCDGECWHEVAKRAIAKAEGK